jgi:hypothetical protein
MTTGLWIFATLLAGMVACSTGRGNGDVVGSPGIGVASVDTDSGSERLGSSAADGNSGVFEDAAVDAPEE